MSHATRALLLAAAVLVPLGTAPAEATSMLSRNLVDLIRLSDAILDADVIAVEDGIDAAGVPYTEVTLQVRDALKGEVTGTYTFRQFGLLEPRRMPDGLVNLNVSPDGWPRFTLGERAVVFLYTPAALTGLRTTVGLLQGKFTVEDGWLRNAVDNRGLFHGVRAAEGLLTAGEAKLLATGSGPVGADAFLGLVRRTVRNRLIEEGRITDAR